MNKCTLVYCFTDRLASHTVPGYMGSQLQVTLDRENTVSTICTKKSETPSTLWLSLFNHQPLQEDCWLENIMLHYDEMTGKSSSDTGVNVTVKAFASTEAIEFITPPPQETSQSKMHVHFTVAWGEGLFYPLSLSPLNLHSETLAEVRLSLPSSRYYHAKGQW